jgi:hypothetical protein
MRIVITMAIAGRTGRPRDTMRQDIPFAGSARQAGISEAVVVGPMTSGRAPLHAERDDEQSIEVLDGILF